MVPFHPSLYLKALMNSARFDSSTLMSPAASRRNLKTLLVHSLPSALNGKGTEGRGRVRGALQIALGLIGEGGEGSGGGGRGRRGRAGAHQMGDLMEPLETPVETSSAASSPASCIQWYTVDASSGFEREGSPWRASNSTYCCAKEQGRWVGGQGLVGGRRRGAP